MFASAPHWRSPGRAFAREDQDRKAGVDIASQLHNAASASRTLSRQKGEPMSLLAELKRRNVLRMAGLYLVVSWLIVQVSSTILPMFAAPDWMPRSIVVLLAIGFVPAMIFSWVYELTPDGLRRDADVPIEKSIGMQTGRRIDRAIIAVLLIALGYFAVDKFVLAPRREAVITTAVNTVTTKTT